VRTFRNNQFIALNDGSTIDNIQCVVDFENTPDETEENYNWCSNISYRNLVESKSWTKI
jgi:asparaginyl-tRNA synthetase